MRLEETMDRETLKYACGRAITYPGCGHVTDVRQAALVTLKGPKGDAMEVMHTTCDKWDFDGFAASLENLDPEVWEYEVIDGRKL